MLPRCLVRCQRCCCADASLCSQIGLHYNGPALTLDPETVTNGRYFVGLGHYFFKFPAKLNYIEFSNSAEGGERNHRINLWTRDGQEVFVRCPLLCEKLPCLPTYVLAPLPTG